QREKKLIRSFQSWSNGPLLREVERFASQYQECLVLGPRHSAGDGAVPGTHGSAGVYRFTLVQLAAELSRGRMAELGLAPISNLGLQALAARVVHRAIHAGKLEYFKPVASLPGFSRALARTLNDLRVGGIAVQELSGDLAVLLDYYEAELA